MADAQFAVDVAASMSGQETLAQLDELTSELQGAGKNAQFFQDAMQQVSRGLASAQEAAKAANGALAEGEAEYARLERAALQVAKAADKAGLANGGVYPAEALAFMKAGNDALAAQAAKLRELEAAAKKATGEETKLSAQQKNLESLNGHVNKSIAGQAESLEKLRFGLSSTGGSLGRLASNALAPVQGFSKLSAEMGAGKAAALAGAGAFAVIAVAIVAVSVAAVAGAVKIAAWAIGLADTYRNATLTQMALEQMHPELVALQDEIIMTANATGLSSAALSDLAIKLHKARVSVADMPAALRAAALAEAALGNGGAQEFIDQINAGKKSVSALAAETQAKLGGIVSKQLLGLDAQSARFSKNIAGLFGGLNIEPALGGLQTLVALFDQNEVAGKAMKFLFESVFQPLIDQAQNAAYVVEAFYLGALIGAVKMYIAVKPAIKAVSELLGFKDTSLADTLDMAKKAGEYFLPVLLILGAVIGGVVLAGAVALAAVILPLVGAALAAAAPFIAAAAAVAALGAAIYQAWQFFKEASLGQLFAQLGVDLIGGLVNGIKNGAGLVIDAVGGVVHGAITGAKKLLGIASPSKVFADIGDNTVAGFTGAIDDGATDAQAAVQGLVSPPANDNAKEAALSGNIGALSSPADAAPAPAAAASSGSSAAITGNTFNLYGVEGAEDAERRIGELLTRLLEGDATQLGSDLGASGKAA